MNNSTFIRSIRYLERWFGVDLLNAKKWTLGTFILGIMGPTVVYAAETNNELLIHIGYIGGVMLIVLLSGLGILELVFNPDTETHTPFAS